MKDKEFLRQNIAFILMCPFLMVMSVILAALYNVLLEFQIYMCAMIVIAEAIALSVQYNFYKKSKSKSDNDNEACEYKLQEMAWQNTREKEDFFALWAHQIKTPIAALKLLLQADERDNAACKNEVFRIENYVEMALNYLRFDDMRNDIVLSQCDLERMVRQVVKKYAPVFIHKHISVELKDLEYKILTDEKWFCFVLEQLLSNALKYTPCGNVTIYAEASEKGTFITVADTGIGIRSEDVPRIFEKGFTGYNGRTDKRASGLGLYLSKGVCDKLGHGLSIVSKENGGTKVTISIKRENVDRRELGFE